MTSSALAQGVEEETMSATASTNVSSDAAIGEPSSVLQNALLAARRAVANPSPIPTLETATVADAKQGFSGRTEAPQQESTMESLMARDPSETVGDELHPVREEQASGGAGEGDDERVEQELSKAREAAKRITAKTLAEVSKPTAAETQEGQPTVGGANPMKKVYSEDSGFGGSTKDRYLAAEGDSVVDVSDASTSVIQNSVAGREPAKNATKGARAKPQATPPRTKEADLSPNGGCCDVFSVVDDGEESEKNQKKTKKDSPSSPFGRLWWKFNTGKDDDEEETAATVESVAKPLQQQRALAEARNGGNDVDDDEDDEEDSREKKGKESEGIAASHGTAKKTEVANRKEERPATAPLDDETRDASLSPESGLDTAAESQPTSALPVTTTDDATFSITPAKDTKKLEDSSTDKADNGKDEINPADDAALEGNENKSPNVGSLTIATVKLDDAASSKTASATKSPTRGRPVQFRNPYPLPPPLKQPRAPEDIMSENTVNTTSKPVRWAMPKPQLEELLLAAKGPSMARRRNACGALKVLTSDTKNQMVLARTIGVLESLVFAARESGTGDARTRAVTAILHLSEPKDNRTIVFDHPGLPACLVKVVEEDVGEARLNACSALALLAKTPRNRDGIVAIKNLLSVVSEVMKRNVGVESAEAAAKKNESILEACDEGDEEDEDDYTDEDDSWDEGDESTFQTDRDESTLNTDRDESTLNTGYQTEYEATDNSATDDGTLTKGDETTINPATSEEVTLKAAKKTKSPLTKATDFYARTRFHACAVLSHLSKHCTVSTILCSHDVMLSNVVAVCREFDHPIHTRCIEFICNLTRFPANNARLARKSEVVDTLIRCGKSKIGEDRIWAIRALQNLTAEQTSKSILATSPLLSLLSVSAVRKTYDEQVAAVAALLNLSTEPGAIVPLTNTKNVVATLVHLAHSPQSTPDVCRMACDALATIGLWLQTLAGSGVIPDGVTATPLPTHSASGWQRWD